MHIRLLVVAGLAFDITAQSTPRLTDVLSTTPSLSNLTAYLQGFPDLVSQLSAATNITLLAPNNDAFAEFLNSSVAESVASDPALIQAILQYHVLNGTYNEISETALIPTMLGASQYTNVTGGQVVEAVSRGGDEVVFYSGLLSNSTTVGQPILFDGGVIHIVDRLLTIPSNASTTALALNSTAAVGAFRALAVGGTLDTVTDVTLFIPNNEAFASIASVMSSTNTTLLTQILFYHVHTGNVLYISDTTNDTTFAMTSGDSVTIRFIDNQIYINNARVILPNVLTSNGVIHIIDEVLNPANSTLVADPRAEGVAFAGATSASDVPFTSGFPSPTSVIATAIATSSTPASASASTSDTRGETKDSSKAWIAGPVVGAVVGLAMIIGGVIFWVRRKAASRHSPSSSRAHAGIAEKSAGRASDRHELDGKGAQRTLSRHELEGRDKRHETTNINAHEMP